MRNLIILRGPDGSGKSRLVHEMKLSQWHVDHSAIIRLQSSPQLDEDGLSFVPPYALRKAHEHLIATLKVKLQQSEFIVCELADSGPPKRGQHENRTDGAIQEIVTLSEKYRYSCTIVDFPATEGYFSVAPCPVPVLRVTPAEFRAAFSHIANPVVELADIDAIVAIGDIHAHSGNLERCLRQGASKGKIAWIFTGDFINKGPNPAHTLRLLASFAEEQQHCYLIAGNHEIILEDWAWRRAPHRDVFSRDTHPDLQSSRYTRKEARSFLGLLQDHVRLAWNGYDILVTHGGLSAPGEHPGLLPGALKRSGVGHPGTDIDRLWERNTDGAQIQIHGHRNHHMVNVSQSSRSFNLEGVDAFGAIQGLVLQPSDSDGYMARGFSLPITPAHARASK